MKELFGSLTRLIGVMGVLGSALLSLGQEATVDLSLTNGTKELHLPLLPGVDEFKILRTSSLSEPFAPATSGSVAGYKWTEAGQSEMEFFRLELKPTDPNQLITATVLNRLAYGPTPDDLARVKQIGVDAYIQEQLAPERIEEDLEIDRVTPRNGDGWEYVTLTGTATSSTLYIYLTTVGDCYLDDLKLVRGTVAEAGANMIANGDFEAGLSGWAVAANLSNSVPDLTIKHGGTSSLHVIANRAGSTSSSSISRTGLGLTSGQLYTLSYWYKPGTNRNSGLVIRLSGSEPGSGGIYSTPGNLATRLAENSAVLNDLTAWHILHAVQSKKQLLEVMLQFLENHFVTQHSKSRDYLDRYYDNDEDQTHATNLEFRELGRWRQALLNPQVTFHELLKISAESPAMIIYLDTVNSRGNAGNVANENYARELLELFSFGVDNGYDQNDITVLSRAWTGWSIRLVDPTNEFNPFAPQTTKLLPGGTNIATIDNLDGIWAFAYKPSTHFNGEKIIFPGKTVPERFGPPYAGRNYELRLPPSGRTGTNWVYVTSTGTASSSDLYIYITGTGDCYIDDLKIVPGTVAELGANAVQNGDFENGLTGWTRSANVTTSTVSTDIKHSGNGALHLISTSAGSSRTTSLYRRDLGLTSGATYTISYWYRPGSSMNGDLAIRLSGSGLDSSPSGIEGIEDGYKVIDHLADQPFTQEYISVKLCRLFVHDDFAHGYDFTDPNLSAEGRLVRDCMRAWEDGTPKGQIRKVLEVIFESQLFRSQAANAQKIKTPLEFTVSAVRALRGKTADGIYAADSDGFSIRSPINRMGRMRLFDRDDPDGYPESGAPWISGGTLAERLRFVQSLMITSTNNPSGKSDAGVANRTEPVRLLKDRLPSSQWNNAEAVADFFLELIYPGEGKANLNQYRTEAIRYLNTADNGVTTSGFAALGNTTVAYDTRVRGMVAALMTFPRFQEQ